MSVDTYGRGFSPHLLEPRESELAQLLKLNGRMGDSLELSHKLIFRVTVDSEHVAILGFILLSRERILAEIITFIQHQEFCIDIRESSDIYACHLRWLLATRHGD